MEIYDTIIVGADITGVSLAYEIQKLGGTCLVLEQERIGFGLTGSTSAHLNNFFDEPYVRITEKFGEEKAKLIARHASDSSRIIRQYISDAGIKYKYDECPF
jgi:glycine/D-amino acid oxidase-like deaminating enzyme